VAPGVVSPVPVLASFEVVPGLAIMLTAAGSNFLGDGLRDMLDPTPGSIESA
jgi:ABC-type dipeptide/oligopeptide/nickel transport system permease subunit